MDDQLMEAILALGADEDAVLELLRQAERQEERGDATLGRDYLMDAGRMKVANPWGAVSDMFVRGQAEKKAKGLRTEAEGRTQRANIKLKEFLDSAAGRTPGSVDISGNLPPGSTPIAIQPRGPVQVPPAPQVTPPAPPQRPATPAPAAAPPPAGRPGPFIANRPPQQAGGEFDIQAILDDLRRQNQGLL